LPKEKIRKKGRKKKKGFKLRASWGSRSGKGEGWLRAKLGQKGDSACGGVGSFWNRHAATLSRGILKRKKIIKENSQGGWRAEDKDHGGVNGIKGPSQRGQTSELIVQRGGTNWD